MRLKRNGMHLEGSCRDYCPSNLYCSLYYFWRMQDAPIMGYGYAASVLGRMVYAQICGSIPILRARCNFY
jgi:hypothetical protein